METVHVQPMQWGSLPNMGDADLQPFSPEQDHTLFRELRDVLRKHDALKRFGVFLIHKHFEVADDEEMTECTDHEARTLTILPRKKGEIDRDVTITTNWIFTETEQVAASCCSCAKNENGHLGTHQK